MCFEWSDSRRDSYVSKNTLFLCSQYVGRHFRVCHSRCLLRVDSSPVALFASEPIVQAQGWPRHQHGSHFRCWFSLRVHAWRSWQCKCGATTAVSVTEPRLFLGTSFVFIVQDSKFLAVSTCILIMGVLLFVTEVARNHYQFKS